jgi:hypothetical protein
VDDEHVRIIFVAPRPLTPEERELLDFLIASQPESAEMKAQAASAKVGGQCSCGCASVTFEVDPASPGIAFSDPKFPHHAEISAQGLNESGVCLSVTLHITGDLRAGDGRLTELEVWPAEVGAAYGYYPPPKVSSLRLSSGNPA